MTDHLTRIEIAERASTLFANGPASRHDLPLGAVSARPEVLDVLEELPDRRYTEPRQVREDLPAFPVGL